MNKADLIKEVAEKAELTQKDTGKVLDALLAAVQGALVAGEKVQLIGFGTFEVRDRAERKGRSPSTGEEIIIPATKVPGFKAGKSFKEAVAPKAPLKVVGGKKKK